MKTLDQVVCRFTLQYHRLYSIHLVMTGLVLDKSISISQQQQQQRHELDYLKGLDVVPNFNKNAAIISKSPTLRVLASVFHGTPEVLWFIELQYGSI